MDVKNVIHNVETDVVTAEIDGTEVNFSADGAFAADYGSFETVHSILADGLKTVFPGWDGERLFAAAERIEEAITEQDNASPAQG